MVEIAITPVHPSSHPWTYDLFIYSLPPAPWMYLPGFPCPALGCAPRLTEGPAVSLHHQPGVVLLPTVLLVIFTSSPSYSFVWGEGKC